MRLKQRSDAQFHVVFQGETSSIILNAFKNVNRERVNTRKERIAVIQAWQNG